MGVVDGQADHGAHQLKLHAHINVGGPEPVHARLLIQLEHAVVGVKHVTHQQLEELLQRSRQPVSPDQACRHHHTCHAPAAERIFAIPQTACLISLFTPPASHMSQTVPLDHAYFFIRVEGISCTLSDVVLRRM